MKTKLITLDFWNTLGVPNPAYSEARTEFLSMYGITRAEYIATKALLDNPGTIKAVTPEQAVTVLLNRSGKDTKSEVVDQIVVGLDTLTTMYPPMVWNLDLLAAMQAAQSSGIMFAIISNTNFVSGYTLWNQIDSAYPNLFEFAQFSGIDRLTKPDVNFFRLAVVNFMVQHQTLLKPAEVYHLGDSQVFDVDGAISAGFKSTLINGKDSHNHLVEIINRIVSDNAK